MPSIKVTPTVVNTARTLDSEHSDALQHRAISRPLRRVLTGSEILNFGHHRYSARLPSINPYARPTLSKIHPACKYATPILMSWSTTPITDPITHGTSPTPGSSSSSYLHSPAPSPPGLRESESSGRTDSCPGRGALGHQSGRCTANSR
ncbi:hypothetical protein OE88DRAFT_1664108 [Heliocybe sulcata]|uniref:Uncharacterized protein n=1 Tax=Heliocybe sulcata TaxID=5364 RepID=A0A5C3MSJ6_9AGAM|nr:hypothetical protein OE88DRAFT_1664108 [Heliocybe sulcata]